MTLTTLNPEITEFISKIESPPIPYQLIDAIGELLTAVLLAILVGIQTGTFSKYEINSYLVNKLDDNVYLIDIEILKAMLPGIPFKIKKVLKKLENLGFLEIVASVEGGKLIQFNSIYYWNRNLQFGSMPKYYKAIKSLWYQLINSEEFYSNK